MPDRTILRQWVRDNLRDTTLNFPDEWIDRELDRERQTLIHELYTANKDWLLRSTVITPVAGTVEYPLPAGVAQIKAVVVQGDNPIRFHYLGAFNPRTVFAPVSRPSYYLIGGYSVTAGVATYANIGLLRVALGAPITIWYVPVVANLSTATDVSVIPEPYQDIEALGAACRLLEAGQENSSVQRALYAERVRQLRIFLRNRVQGDPITLKDVWV